MNKTEKIILAIVGVLLLGVIIYFMFISGKPKFTYYEKRKVKTQVSNMLIENYSDFEKFISTTNIEGEITNKVDFSKSDILDVFNEQYFEKKKIAVVVTYEIETNSYIYCIDDVKYNSDKSNVTVYYTDERGEYVGPKMNYWYNYMFVEVDGKVSSADFVKTEKTKK